MFTGRDNDQSLIRQLLTAGTVGVHFALCVFAGFAIGYGLDKLFGLSYLKFVFFVFGVAAGFAELLRVVRKQEKKNAGEAAGDDKKNN